MVSRQWIARVGDRRVAVVWLLYAWAVVQQSLLFYGAGPFSSYLERASPLHLALLGCALLTCVIGPRPILFLATSLVAGSILWRSAAGHDPRFGFPAAELPLFLVLPLGSLLSCLAAGKNRSEPDLTRALLWCYRISLLCAMGFATLHKVNADFFDAELSCTTILSRTLPQWWHTTAALPASLVDPIDVVLSEAAMALLLVLYWPLGLLFTIGFTTGLAMVGPTAFTAVVVSATPAFAREGDFTRAPIPKDPGLYLWLAGVVAVLTLVPAAYHGPPTRPWPQFALYLVVAIGLTLVALGSLSSDLRKWRGRRATLAAAYGPPSEAPPTPLEAGRAPIPLRPRLALPARRPLRIVLLSLAVALVVNGFTPYLGLKYHFSFSMLSNLRADDVRWNSLLVPKWARVWRRDPYVHVDGVRIVVPPDDSSDPFDHLFAALFAPYAFAARVEAHLRHGHVLSFAARYRNRIYRFENAETRADLEALLEALPADHLWPEVQAFGPQPCVH